MKAKMHDYYSKVLVLLSVIVMPFLLLTCQGNSPPTSPTFALPTVTYDSPSPFPALVPATSTSVVVVTVTYDEQEIQQRQREADQGHFALSISDPAYTAMDYLSVHFSDFGTVKKPPRLLRHIKDKLAVVGIESGDKEYIVTLEKLARQDETGVWFVTRIEIVPIAAEMSTPMHSLTPRSESVSTEGPQSEAPITFTGTVQDVMRSARIIMLQEPVEGFLYVSLTQDTRLISIEGQKIVLQDIKAGMRIRVTGRPGSSGTLLAEEVQLLP